MTLNNEESSREGSSKAEVDRAYVTDVPPHGVDYLRCFWHHLIKFDYSSTREISAEGLGIIYKVKATNLFKELASGLFNYLLHGVHVFLDV